MKKFFLMSIIALILVAGIIAATAQTAAQKKAKDPTPNSSSAKSATGNVEANDQAGAPKTAEEFRSLGQSRYETNKFKEAVDAFKKSLRLEPNEARTHYSLGLAYAALTDYNEAANSFKRAAILQPAWPEPHFRLGWMYYVLGKREQSLQEARVLNELDPRLASKLDKILNVNTGAEAANKGTTKPSQPKSSQANTDAAKSADHTQQPNSTATTTTTKAVNKPPNTSAPGNALVEKSNSNANNLIAVNQSSPNSTASTSSVPVNNAPNNSANSNPIATPATTGAATTNAQGSADTSAPSAAANATTNSSATSNPASTNPPSTTNATNIPTASNPASASSSVASAPTSNAPTSNAPTPNAPASNAPTSNTTTTGAPVSGSSTTTSAATPVKSETVPSIPASAMTDEASLPNIYRVGVGDVLDIRLINSPTNRSTLFTVLDGGLIEYPLAGGSVQVAGLTTEEIVARLTAELNQRSALSEKSQVAVGVREYASHTIIVGGLVNYSGARVLRREAVPLYVVLAEAQPRTEAGRAVIMRSTGQNIIDLADPAAMATLVRPGDVINLSARVQQYYFIGGQVPAPGQKVFQPGLTLLQAILAAGGSIKPEDNIVELSREGDGGRLTTNKLQLKDIKSGKVPDPRLQPGDRIDVSH